jgi:hypothetical protein
MYWLRDIKKCGLTFPRELFHIIQECLSEVYPDKDFSRFDIYRYYNILDVDSKHIEAVRGYCLGMANNLITYAQCICYRMLGKRIPKSIDLDILCGNDDSCLRITSKESSIDHIDAILVQTEDINILRGLNIITNDAKSFWSWYPILFKNFGHQDFKVKHSRIACALSSAMVAPDIKYAKLLTSSVSLSQWENGEWLEPLVRELISKWGYEYYSDECNYDYILGGWFATRSKGLSLALRQIDTTPDELLQPMWIAINQMIAFNKEVIKPVLDGTVTKNYSIIGSKFNISYLDLDRREEYEKCLPLETLFLNEGSFKKFYESVFKFNRFPYKEMAKRLRRVTSVYPGVILNKVCFQEFILRNFNKLAIPESLVESSSYLYEEDCLIPTDSGSLRFNSLSRYLMYLKNQKILMMPDLDFFASGEYPYVRNFDEPPSTERINAIHDINGDIPEGVYQFSTNPWLPLYEYVKEFDQYPVLLKRVVEDKEHLPIWFMTRPYRDSREVSIAYNNMHEGELYVDYAIELIRECLIDETEIKQPDESGPNYSSCDFCSMQLSWEKTDDIFTIYDSSCITCIVGDQIWCERKLSVSADTIEKRREHFSQVPIIRSRMRYLIEHYFDYLTDQLPYFLQEEEDDENDLFYAPVDEYNEDELFAMFGD